MLLKIIIKKVVTFPGGGFCCVPVYFDLVAKLVDAMLLLDM